MEFLFTREQYKDIVNNNFLDVFQYGLAIYLKTETRQYIEDNKLTGQAMELVNPYTRVSAASKYVEPETKYTWYYEDTDRFINKVEGDPQWFLDDDLFDTLTKFTEEEIDASPFKKEFFRKEK